MLDLCRFQFAVQSEQSTERESLDRDQTVPLDISLTTKRHLSRPQSPLDVKDCLLSAHHENEEKQPNGAKELRRRETVPTDSMHYARHPSYAHPTKTLSAPYRA